MHNFSHLPNSKWAQRNPNVITRIQTVETFKFKEIHTKPILQIQTTMFHFNTQSSLYWSTCVEKNKFINIFVWKTCHQLSSRVPHHFYWQLTERGEIGVDFWRGLFWLRLRKGIKDGWKVVWVIITETRHGSRLLVRLWFNWGLGYWWILQTTPR